jgi:heme exporter protein A
MTLRVTNLSCRRSDRLVFADLSFTVPVGQALLVQGPNGIGKSTLLRVLAGLMKPAAGDAEINGVTLSQLDDWTPNIAFLGHLDAVKPQLTFAQNLRFWTELYGQGEIAQALAAFNLSHMADQPAQIASAGMRKRLALARLLLVKRPLWLLDEPLSSLDAASQTLLENILTAHLAQGGIAVIATHQPVSLPHSTLRLGAT